MNTSTNLHNGLNGCGGGGGGDGVAIDRFYCVAHSTGTE